MADDPRLVQLLADLERVRARRTEVLNAGSVESALDGITSRLINLRELDEEERRILGRMARRRMILKAREDDADDDPVTPTPVTPVTPVPVALNDVWVWAAVTNTLPAAIPSGAVSGWPTVTTPTPAANGYLIVAQVAADNDLDSIQKHGIEQFGTYTKGAAVFSVAGVDYEWWYSAGPLFPAALAGTRTFGRVT